MTFFDALTGGAEEAGADIGAAALAPLIRKGLDEGLSATQMLNEARSAGVAVRTQSWYQLVGQVRASSARAEVWANAPLDQLPGADLIQDWSGGHTDTYLNRVYMYVRTHTGGELGVERRAVNVLTRDLITPGDALDMATSLYEDNADSDNYGGDTFLGAEFAGVYHQLGGS